MERATPDNCVFDSACAVLVRRALKPLVRRALSPLALTCAAALLASSCSTQPLRSSYQRLPASAHRTTLPFGTYTWGVGNEELLSTNVFRASEPLCLAYTPPSRSPRNISQALHFRIVRDDPNDVFGYRRSETIIAPRDLMSSTNAVGSVTYSYTFERAGLLSQEYLGPAKQYRCTAEYWENRKNPKRFRLGELLYLVPAVNVAYVFFTDYYRNKTRGPPLFEQHIIKIVD